MRNYVKYVIAFSIIMIMGILAFIMITGDMSSAVFENDENVLTLNDIAKTSGEQWGNIDGSSFGDYKTDFAVLDMNGNILFESGNAKSKHNIINDTGKLTVEAAVKKRIPYKYIVKDGVVVGSVILFDTNNIYAGLKAKLIIAFIVMAAFFILGAIVYGAYVKKNIVVPFKRLESFAGKVAEGKLDEPLMMEKDNMFGIFTESFDIMREELAESKKREIALQKKERELVASLSHDLKTPITGIKLTSELLRAKVENKNEGCPIDSDDMLIKINNIYNKADQMDKLISDLFSSTLDDLGEIKVNCQDEEAAILNKIIKHNDDRGLAVLPKAPCLIISIDKNRMNQVIGNIITNSYKYANTKIDVEYSLVEDYLELMIRDFGPGVSMEELSAVTNKFYRGKNAEEKQKEGSGLGLYISKSLMEKMNGELICQRADENGGFSVKLLIPLS